MSGPKHGGTLSCCHIGLSRALTRTRWEWAPAATCSTIHRVFDGIIEVGPDGGLVNKTIESWEANERSERVHDQSAVRGCSSMTVRPLRQRTSSTRSTGCSHPESFGSCEGLTVVSWTLSRRLTLGTLDVQSERFERRSFPRDLSDYHLRVLPSHVDFSKIADGSIGGSGPFVKVSHNPSEKTAYVRNSNYWEGEKPYVDQLVLYYMPEVTTRVEALRAGAIDYGDIEDFTQVEVVRRPRQHLGEVRYPRRRSATSRWTTASLGCTCAPAARTRPT